MNARERRLTVDFINIKEHFRNHQYIRVKPVDGKPPVRYLVTYRLKGLKLNKETNQPVESYFHEVEILLHKNYPREKPICKMKTEIFHPNFKSKVWIADHWQAGECLVNTIIQIGQMIQYQNYNSKSPLNVQASTWTVKNRHLLPVGNIDLTRVESTGKLETHNNKEHGIL